MSQTKLHQRTAGHLYSIFLVCGSLLSVFLFGAIIVVLSSSFVNQSGMVTRTRTAEALFLMWIGLVGFTIGGTLYLSEI